MVAGLPDELAHLSWLIGRWVGVGTGQYPTIEDFRFGQEVSFSTDGRPFLSYWSRSWLLDDDGNQVRPLATEAGFWRPRPENGVEVTLDHPTGFAELWYGAVEVTGLENATITGARATLRTGDERLYGLVDGKLLWTFDMAAMGQPLQNHLAASLVREDAAPQESAELDPKQA
jgi:hypothetical protein